MFQYAFGRSLSLKYNRNLIIDKSYFEHSNYPHFLHPYYDYKLDIYNTVNSFTSTKLSKYINVIGRKRIYYISNLFASIKYFDKHLPYYMNKYNFSFEKAKNKNKIFLYGHWQNFSIVDKYFDTLRNELLYPSRLSSQNQKYLRKITSQNSISVSFRRKDYITNPVFRKKYSELSMNYYKKSINYLNKVVDNPIYFLFSDDINWVKRNFKLDCTHIFVDTDGPVHEHQYLITQCKHNIIANSTFSWWGAYLNNNPDKVIIAPKRWYKNNENTGMVFYPEKWTLLDDI